MQEQDNDIVKEEYYTFAAVPVTVCAVQATDGVVAVGFAIASPGQHHADPEYGVYLARKRARSYLPAQRAKVLARGA